MEDATAYVSESVVLCVYGNSSPLREDLESRFAPAEFEAAKDQSRLAPDDWVAAAFNFMSDEFGVKNAVAIGR